MKRKSILYLVFFALFVSFGHILQKIVINHGVDRFIFAFLRIASGFIIITALLTRRKFHPIRVIRENYFPFIILGFFFSGCGILLKLWGLQYTTATNASFIMSLSSLNAIIFSAIFLKEKSGIKFYSLAILMLGGVYLVSTGGSQLIPANGDLIILTLSVLIGSMRVYSKTVLQKTSVLETVFGRSLFGMIFLAVSIFIFSPHGFETIKSIPILILILSNGITFSLSIILFYKALQMEAVSNSGMFALLAPVFTAILGFSILGESLNLYQLLGAVVILTGSIFISRQKITQQESRKDLTPLT
jgi:drug/metabolite transporter (DMT)-like permease